MCTSCQWINGFCPSRQDEAPESARLRGAPVHDGWSIVSLILAIVVSASNPRYNRSSFFSHGAVQLHYHCFNVSE